MKNSCFFLTSVVIVLLLTCDKWERDNPLDPDGINWHPPVVVAMQDTVVAIKDSFYIHAMVTDSKNAIIKYLWALDGINYLVGTQSGLIKLAFAAAGVKLVLVKVVDNDGLYSKADSTQVTVKLFPPVVVAMQDSVVAINDSFYLHALGADSNGTIIKYLWALDGTNYHDSTDNGLVKVAFPLPGIKPVLVKVWDDDGVESVADSVNVTVKLFPPNVKAMQDSVVAINDSFYVHAMGSDTNGTIKKYLWALDGGNYRDSTDNGRVKVAFPLPGIKIVLVKVRDDDGVESTVDNVNLTVKLFPPVVVAMQDSVVAINDSFYLHALGTDSNGTIIKYLWAFDGTNYRDSTVIGRVKVAFATLGVKMVLVKIRDDDGVESAVDSVNIMVKDNPPINLTPGNGANISTVCPTLQWIPGMFSKSFTVLLDLVNPPIAVAKIGVVDSFLTLSTTLDPYKNYYWQVVGYNATGQEARGEVWMFKILVPITDIDGNVYHPVAIGTQIWLVENLKTTRYNDGTTIPLVTNSGAWNNLSTSAYCWYDNDITNKATYGALYNWYAVNTGKLALKGWHVPLDAEWTILENYLIANGFNWDGTTTGNKIAKSLAAKTGWGESTNPGAIGNDLTKNNASGFSAFPGGERTEIGPFFNIGWTGDWWSASENDVSSAYYRGLLPHLDYLNKPYGSKSCGFAVRLVRD